MVDIMKKKETYLINVYQKSIDLIFFSKTFSSLNTSIEVRNKIKLGVNKGELTHFWDMKSMSHIFFYAMNK